MAEARCPASCGELIQGWVLGSEKLISCPINWFSTVEVCDGVPEARERPRMRDMLKRVLRHFDLPEELHQMLRIRFDSTIPVAKGMASSTADIAATAVATARHLNQRLTEQEIADICLQIEPTDSTIFSDLTLFDHNTGQTQIGHNWSPELNILILESEQQLITADYHRLDRRHALLANAGKLEQSWIYFQEAARNNDVYKLGQAATLSAKASQNILPKPAFDKLLKLIETHDLYGLNVAHSGTVVGLFFNENRHDIEHISRKINEMGLGKLYPYIHCSHMITGGVR